MAVQGTFIVSLDLELFWGMQDVTTLEAYGPRILGERAAIPRMLELFAAYDIHATWATVGMLAYRDRKQLEGDLPSVRPGYAEAGFSNYTHLLRGAVGGDETSDPYHFGASLLELIRATPGQEIACHTFAHYYCLEKGADPESFAADLAAWKHALAGRGELTSIVFPRNQYAPEYLAVCRELGVRAYRGVQDHPIYASVDTAAQYGLRARAQRLIDAYVNVTGHHTYPLEDARSSTPVNVRASRFLRPYEPRAALLEPLKLRRITAGVSHAAAVGEAFHLWWHPHNFGLYTDENLHSLEQILKHVAALRTQGRMVSRTMGEAAQGTV